MRASRWVSEIVGLAAVALFVNPAAGGTARYVSPSGTEAGGYTNWATAAKTIQKAVNACVDGDTVWVTNGVYSTTSQVSVVKGVTVSSVNGAVSTVIDGGGWTSAGSNRCLFLSNSNAVVDGFTIRNGNLYISQQGAGVLIISNGLVRNSIICSNLNYNSDGGGVALIGGGTVRNCLIVSNASAVAAGDPGYGGESSSGVRAPSRTAQFWGTKAEEMALA